MKKLILAMATIGVAAMMVACDDDDSSSAGGSSGNLVSCDMKMSMTDRGMKVETHYCGETENTSENKAILKKECKSYEEDGITYTAKIGTGCPSGADKVCNDEDGTSYFYDDPGLSCEDLMGDDED